MRIFGIKRSTLYFQIFFFGFCLRLKRYSETKIRERYENKLKELVEKFGNEKIKVGFLVSEPAKWQYQSIYEALDKSDEFEPVVLVTALRIVHRGRRSSYYYKTIEECFDFFKAKGLNVRYAYNVGEKTYVHSKDLGVDILFYQQPWELDDSQHPLYCSRYALTCYVSYSIELLEAQIDYTQTFHHFLWRFYVDTEENLQRYESYRRGNAENCVVVGIPKLDEYVGNACGESSRSYWRSTEKFKIIYAPHHSFESDGLRLGTFQKNGRFILEYARRHPETTWLFKPHPRFKEALFQNRIMSEQEIDDYYEAWNEIGSIYTLGDYFDIFRTSDMMITDSCSFLAEYLPTLHPIVRLIDEHSVPLNNFGRKICAGYYEVSDNEELEKVCDSIQQHKDEKRALRSEISENLVSRTKVGIKVLNNIKENIR
jgi:CDP-glycerol glycerophosphotransferase (TagB/SpsB family)